MRQNKKNRQLRKAADEAAERESSVYSRSILDRLTDAVHIPKPHASKPVAPKPHVP